MAPLHTPRAFFEEWLGVGVGGVVDLGMYSSLLVI